VTELKRINGQQDSRTVPVRNGYTYKTNVFNNVFRRQKYLNEINDFPTLCIRATGEDRLELGAGVRFGTFGFEIRGYVKEEETIETEEDLADDIEFVLENLTSEATSETREITDVRITSTETDEGLMTPFGVIIINGILRYQQDATV
tara:strand:+ start:253 stop:693 length:441 start_codon:yes stop_codon:yes gene_type:complete